MRLRLGCTLALATAALLLSSGASASAAIPFCTFGSGPGQCKEPSGVAVDTTNGRVYVADPGNNRINVFDEDGNFISLLGTPGSGPGQLSGARQVAVDNDSTSPNFGDVYVTDSSPRVQRFSSAGAYEATIGAGALNRANPQIAVIPGGDLYAIDSVGPGAGLENRQVKIFDAAGALIRSSTIGTGFVYDAAVDSTGKVFIARNDPNSLTAIEEFEASEPTAILLSAFDVDAQTKALALDSADNLYAGQGFPRRFITKRDSSGAIVKRFGYGEIEANLKGLAMGATGELFGSEELGSGIRIAEPAPGAVACCLVVLPDNTKATLEGAVNPEGKAATYHFEYLTEADYVTNGNSFTGANPAAKAPESTPVGSDFELYPAQTEIGCAEPEVPPQDSCLDPLTEYRYRLVAKNADGENVTAAGAFTTKPPFELLETYATDAGTDAVRLHATVNPLGIPASTHFEYVDNSTYQASGFAAAAKTPSVGLGSGNEPKAVSAHLNSLVPGTTYHYRAVVSDPFASETGPERTVTTFPLPAQPASSCPNAALRTGPSAFLPDCRAYEMVSLVDKNGGDVKVLPSPGGLAGSPPIYPARLEQSSTEGDRFAYSSATAFANALSAPWTSQYLATRTSDGWSTEAINPPRESKSLSDNIVMKLDAQYRAFSPNLSQAWLLQDANPTLDECAPEGFMNLYRRDNLTGAYEALAINKPTTALADYRLEVQGSSADGTRTVFRANAKLTKDASDIKDSAGGPVYQLYEHVRGEGCGELRVISRLPNGNPHGGNSSAGTPRKSPAGYRDNMVARAVSADGSRVFFSLSIFKAAPLLVRVNADRAQSAIGAGKCTEPEKGCTLEISATRAQYWTAAIDGSKAIYSVGEKLLEYDVDKALAGETASRLIAGGLPLDGEGSAAIGVAGASEDASRIYFVSREEIDGEGEEGDPNLYLYQSNESGDERYRLVRTLSDLDVAGFFNFFGFGVGTPEPIDNGVRLTPDGTKLAFVSTVPLTGYDNTDASDGRPALEVFLYDAETDDLACVSCNPSGARPEGRRFQFGVDVRRVAAMMPAGQTQTFAPRVLSEDGNSLFFESYESLLPRDTNGKADAYQWQRAGSQAECEENGAELYVPSSGGCLSLISTGQSPIDTEIADASPDGSNVFIRTAESLLPQDPGQVDIYDVRVNGGFPQPPSQPAACEGEACQGPLSPPRAPTPASLGFQGAGNVREPAPKPRCAKGKARRKGRCVPRKPGRRASHANKTRRAGR